MQLLLSLTFFRPRQAIAHAFKKKLKNFKVKQPTKRNGAGYLAMPI